MTTEAKDYKATLNLPQTEFPMKGNLDKLEPKLLERWEKEDLFAQVMKKNAGRPLFVLHDGPPYANGHLHAGHALNKVLKDIVVKYRNLSGKLADYVPGWDCHGLPIEQAAEKRLRDKKIDKRTLSTDEFLAKCREYAGEFVNIQRDEFKRLGVLGRWAEPYQTMTFDYEAQEIRELAKFAAKGSLYRKKKPVYWCLTDATALAEAEVEYADHTSPSVYVAFPAKSDLSAKFGALKGKAVSFVIWTTTPWTLPANLAISVHPEFEYVFYELPGAEPMSGPVKGPQASPHQGGERVLCVAKGLLAKFLSEVAPAELKVKQVTVGGGAFDAAVFEHPERILAYATGTDLSTLLYTHVLNGKVCPVITGEHVTLEAGTGLVHTAPGHGQEDYVAGLANGLEVYNPVKNDGKFDDTVPERLRGLKVFDANPVVVDWLVELGVLLNDKNDKLTHSYPHCWRCHNAVIFRATHQWFIALEHDHLRKKALDQIDTAVQWVPKWGRDRIRGMLEGRPDWCISRQRTWGVPIAIAMCEKCEEPVIDAAMMNKVADAVEKEGAGVWYRTPVKQFLPAGYACKACKGTEFRAEKDILDVWFDSACSYAAVAAKRPNHRVPVDLYLEGSDQHRGWFHSSLLVAVGTMEKAPYTACLTHGFVVDGNGNKMSKSQGNVVAPEEIIKKFGAEVLRLWVASSDYRDDVRLGQHILTNLSEGYRKIRNTLRYALSNLYDFDPAKDAAPLLPLDAWAVARHGALVEKVRAAYENYEFHTVYHSVVDFCAGDLSALYFDIQKDPLYTSKKAGAKRRSAQTALYQIVKELLVVLAPIMSFTCEEAWEFLPGAKPASVFLAEFPGAPKAADPKAMERFEKLFALRAQVTPLLEAARRDKVIGKATEAKVVLTGVAPDQLADLRELLIVSQVELAPTPSAKATQVAEGVTAEVQLATGNKCPRCWTFATEVPAQEICNRCKEALS